MMFSKSFGYALRGVLYLSMMQEKKEKVQLHEIATKLGIPRHFLAKIMKLLVKNGILSSTKGPFGGYCANESTDNTTLEEISRITENNNQHNICAIRFRQCSSANPCPLHNQIQKWQDNIQELLRENTIGSLLKENNHLLVRSISAI